MVNLRLRELHIIVQSDIGQYGVKLPLTKGLVVIRAENSAGKSTLVQSIIYALGLEGMLSASRDVPLPHAMTHRIDAEDGSQHVVNSSEVRLEFENHDGTIVTVVRRAKGAVNHNLITLIHGPALSAEEPPTPYHTEDKYVRDGGAATSATGFHFWLASFLGWALPFVVRFDGKKCPLYLECTFPLMLVEQKKAWTGIQARMPTQFQIRDVAKRAIEFILNLSVFEQIAKRQNLLDERERLTREWQRWCLEASAAARQAGGIITGLSDDPMEKWAENGAISLMLFREKNWVDVTDAKARDEKEIEELKAKQIPTVSAVSNQLAEQLKSAEDELASIQVSIADLAQDVSAKRSQLTGINARLTDLADDLSGNKALRKIRIMGSKNAPKSVVDHLCPTCHQTVDDSLLPQDKKESVMSLDDSIEFIAAQQKIYEAARDGLARSLAVTEAELAVLRGDESEIRAKIRAHRTSLVTEGHAPSRAAIESLLSAEARITRANDAEVRVEACFAEIRALCPQWAKTIGELKKCPDDYLSDDDRRKIKELQRLFQEHVTSFDVKSIPPSEITLSLENYKPEHEGFDLEFDLSASDLIRTIWAYLLSLLEIARTEPTNHLGLLVLDEPQQQGAKRESFAKFFARAQMSLQFDQQVIVTSSEKTDELKNILIGVKHTFIEFTGEHVLTRSPGEPGAIIITAGGDIQPRIESTEDDKNPLSTSDEDDIPF